MTDLESELLDFAFYAKNYTVVSRNTQLEIIGRCLLLTSIEEIIDIYKNGWLGPEGNLARIIARMLSQFE
jgi:hypothetical protein